MNSEKFVDYIVKERLKKRTIEGIIDFLIEVPGRSPNKDDVENSKWFNSLKEIDKEFVKRIIDKTVDDTLFGFLAMFDGVALWDDNGDYELYYIDKKTKERILLNNPDEMELHALYNAVEE